MSDADEGGARRKSLGRLASAKGILSFICSSIRAFKTNIVVSFGLGSDMSLVINLPPETTSAITLR